MPVALRRLNETERKPVAFFCDGKRLEALQGDTLLTAVLTHGGILRHSEFNDEPRAGFCLMGACNDCMMWVPDGSKVRACSTMVSEDIEVFTRMPEAAWPPLIR